MRYRLMATYQGVPYEAGVGPSEDDVVLFAACPPPEELGFEPATGHWRKQLRMSDIQALWESRPTGTFRGERCIILDDMGDRLHIAYLGHDSYQAEQLGYWQVDRGVFELVAPREEVTDVTEERSDYPHRDAQASRAWSGPQSWPGGAAPSPGGAAPSPAPAAGPDQYPPAAHPSAPYRTAPHPIVPQSMLPAPGLVPAGPPASPSRPEVSQPGLPRRGASQPGPPPAGLSQPGLPHPGLPPGAEPVPAAEYREPPLPLEAAAMRAASQAARRRSRAASPALPDLAHPDLAHPDLAAAPLAAPRRRADRPRLTTQRNFTDLAELARIPAAAYAVGAEVDGAMCLVPTAGGFEVFHAADGARHEVRLFADEESAYFYLFGVLAAEAVRTGGLMPRG
jgi:hypothetical protein